MLLLDAGNTQVKWARLQAGRVAAIQRCDHGQLADRLPSALVGCKRLLACNVAGPALAETVAAVCAAAGVALHWVQVQRQCLGMTTHYAELSQLGPDRWLSALAAWQGRHGNVLVVNVGTAITVDAVTAGGDYLGGTISPGIRLMRDALAQGTARLGRPDGHYAAFPGNTADAIHSGIVHAAVGPVYQLAEHLCDCAGSLDLCLLSGGDAHWLVSCLNMPLQTVDNLVLHGLAAYSQTLAENRP